MGNFDERRLLVLEKLASVNSIYISFFYFDAQFAEYEATSISLKRMFQTPDILK